MTEAIVSKVDRKVQWPSGRLLVQVKGSLGKASLDALYCIRTCSAHRRHFIVSMSNALYPLLSTGLTLEMS